ncbi:15-hydroxyprostaglandin dehydrogenase [Trichonephila inaurata madagascariensis]|uniref:15-hydroxyprostaglandin dehydrogenase [NAD(+)] n=1 Tax=Trichonephila inaurata madagascariensis TaxID=2747483 RepID=A0A8X7CAN0_9ARAC|nr:15-hydroxyprostaglandin dehydrogenase [Trichonephila inaurata madagascariensis]
MFLYSVPFSVQVVWVSPYGVYFLIFLNNCFFYGGGVASLTSNLQPGGPDPVQSPLPTCKDNVGTILLQPVTTQVCIGDLLEDPAKECIDNLPSEHKNRVIFQKLDVSSFPDFKNAFDKVISTFGRIDMVINNAGMFSEQNFQKVIEVNILGVIYGTKLAFEYMDISKGGHGGHVINTASEAERIKIYSFHVQHEFHFKQTGVTVNAICPGPVDTGFFRAFPTKCIDVAEAKKLSAKMRPVTPEDVAKALMKLLEDGKNGAIIRIDIDGLRYV